MKKRKLTCLLLCSLVFSGTLNGCGKESVSNSKPKENSEIIETTQSTVETDAIQTTTEIPTENATEEQSNFDFLKVLESTYICGQQLTYPLTWGQFSDDFTIDYESASINPEKQTISAFVKYKGYDVGMFGFTGCTSVDTINADTAIRGISVFNKDMEFFSAEKIKVNNLSLGINHSQLFDSLGNNYNEGVGYEQITYKDDVGVYRFTFNEEDILITVGLNLIKK